MKRIRIRFDGNTQRTGYSRSQEVLSGQAPSRLSKGGMIHAGAPFPAAFVHPGADGLRRHSLEPMGKPFENGTSENEEDAILRNTITEKVNGPTYLPLARFEIKKAAAQR